MTRDPNRLHPALLMLFLGVVSAMTACTTVTRNYDGYDADTVWHAVEAAAADPNYGGDDPTDRWHVRANEVQQFAEPRRIEVYRELERTLHVEQVRPRHERRDWKFQIVLEQNEPPVVVFRSRGFGVPMQAVGEGNRFFADVDELLGFVADSE